MFQKLPDLLAKEIGKLRKKWSNAQRDVHLFSALHCWPGSYLQMFVQICGFVFAVHCALCNVDCLLGVRLVVEGRREDR